MLLNQQHQSDIDSITPMPCDRVDDSSTVNTSTAEAVVWYYNNSGAWGAAVGEAAGTMVTAKLTYDGVTNGLGGAVGNYYDTSLSFAAATRAATLVNVPEEVFSKMSAMSVTNKMAEIAKHLTTNGEYAIDHRRGVVWLLSLDTVANDSATYKYKTPLSGGSAGDKVDVIKIGGVAVLADDAAFTEGTTPVLPAGFVYDDAAALDSGDVGAARVTSDRKQIMSGEPTLVDLLDTTDLAADTHYYPAATGGEIGNNKDLSLSGKFIDADGTFTMTIEATDDEDTASADWIQVYGYDDKNNATTNSWTVTNGTLTFALSFNNINYNYYRVKVVNDGATNTAIIKARLKTV